MKQKFSAQDVEWLRIIAKNKWPENEKYSCLLCSNKNYFQGKSPFSRKCTKCKHEESVISGTVFHGMRISISKAMAIFESLMLSTSDYMDGIFENPRKLKKFKEGILPVEKGYLRISSVKLAKDNGIQQKTAWSFLNKIMQQLDNRKFNEKDIERMGEAYINFRSWFKWVRVERTAGYAALFMLVLRFNISDLDKELERVLQDLVRLTHNYEKDDD